MQLLVHQQIVQKLPGTGRYPGLHNKPMGAGPLSFEGQLDDQITLERLPITGAARLTLSGWPGLR